jgi:DNA-directed RNA polymerase specialized sigma24 family protein
MVDIKNTDESRHLIFRLLGDQKINPKTPFRVKDEHFHQILHEALDRLSSEQRKVVLMRLDEKQFSEMAEEEQCSVNTQLGRMRYALKNLRLDEVFMRVVKEYRYDQNPL